METIKNAKQKFIAFFGGINDNDQDLSYFDVKALYDAAYDEKAKARACLQTYKILLERAEMLDGAYRAQIQAEFARTYGKAA